MKILKLNIKGFLTCLVILGSTTAVPQWHKAIDGREYLIETDLKFNWHQAWHECARREAQLVAIESPEKNHAIIELLKAVIGKSHNLWLGGNDEYSSSRDYARPFFWSATGKPFSFTFWSNNNPDNYKNQEHCVHIWDTKPLYEWNDIDCNNKMGFICEQNHFLAACNNSVQQKCEAFRKTNSNIANEHGRLQEKQLTELNSITENMQKYGNDWKIELEKLQKSTQMAVQEILKNHEQNMQQMSENMLKTTQNFDEQIRQSVQNLHESFVEKLKVNQEEINKIC